MGTSISQRSPRTLGWTAVARGYEDERIPIERLVREIWRAAQAEPNADWGRLLGAPIIATCLAIVLGANSPEQAIGLVSREIARSRQSSLATDVAKRAVVQSFSAPDRAEGFAEALFSEAANYLVSRDLSGFVGTKGRNQTVADAIAFKDAIRTRVADVVRQAGGPPPSSDAGGWQQYVGAVTGRLR